MTEERPIILTPPDLKNRSDDHVTLLAASNIEHWWELKEMEEGHASFVTWIHTREVGNLPPVKALREAVAPLASFSELAVWEGKPDNAPIYAWGDTILTIGDIKRAKAALAAFDAKEEATWPK